MKRLCSAVLLLAVSFGWGCGSGSPSEQEEASSTPLAAPSDQAAAEPAFLPRPYTAEQIAAEWVAGFTLKLRRTTPDREHIERWTVMTADDAGADIEFAMMDEAGNLTGEPQIQRQSWEQLRNHATYPAGTSEREEVTRESALGTHEGWLYTTRDEMTGTVTEFFFAKDLPGAPVHMRATRDGEVVLELAQLDRHRPQ